MSENVTQSEKVDKGIKNLDYMKEVVVTIHRKYLDNFEGKSKGSTGWFNLDIFFKESFLHLNRTSIENFMKSIFKVKICNHIKRL